MRHQRFKIFLGSLLLVCSTLGHAQDKLAWTDLSEPEQQVLQQLEEQWDELSAERQQRLRRGALRWLQMRPEERESAQAIQRRFQNLSPQQQQQINQRFQRFNQLERERQQQLRNIQRRFRNLPEEERERLRERFEAQAEQRQELREERAERRREIRDRNLGATPRRPETRPDGGAGVDTDPRPGPGFDPQRPVRTRPPGPPPGPRR
ncbi:MAG: DUF3106 domain-containing protein [Gammaproteobacteria bacterium]|nr:DUF3106 domain-containing protein [Pseudomonadales bacterium]MCP5345685.1 DUF3106 domain-containing protein [Pseudomonadales bacterium]